MNRKFKLILPILFVFSLFTSFQTSANTINTDPKDKLLITILRYVLTEGHYKPQKIDDAFSEKVYTRFLEGLDPSKRYFLQSDIDEFRREGTMDEASLDGSVSITNDVLNKQPPSNPGPFINNIDDDTEIMHLRMDDEGNLIEKTPSEVNRSIRKYNQNMLKGKL